LDGGRISAPEYAAIEDRAQSLLGTARDTFVFQGEAVVALEAAARGLGRPGLRALNLVSGPYGETFGRWLSEGGATVDNVVVPFDQAVPAELVREAGGRMGDVHVVSLAHAEAATGAVNDLAAIAKVAKSMGALVVVDAVASVGAEALLIDEWDLDIVVLSAQKALAGPAGASIVVASNAAWSQLEANSWLWRGSVLSLLDWRDNWLRAGRPGLPVIPAHLETRALGAALERVAATGLDKVIASHQAAARATRAALGPLGLAPWVAADADAAAIATVVKAPSEGPQALLAAVVEITGGQGTALGLAPPPLSDRALRVNHTGRGADLGTVLATVAAMGRAGLEATGCDVDVALAVAAKEWFNTRPAR